MIRIELYKSSSQSWWCWRCRLRGYSQWFSVLSQVHGSTEQEIREMHDEQANPQNAVVSSCKLAQPSNWKRLLMCFIFMKDRMLNNIFSSSLRTAEGHRGSDGGWWWWWWWWWRWWLFRNSSSLLLALLSSSSWLLKGAYRPLLSRHVSVHRQLLSARMSAGPMSSRTTWDGPSLYRASSGFIPVCVCLKFIIRTPNTVTETFSLSRERWMSAWSIQFVLPIIQRGKNLRQRSRHVSGLSQSLFQPVTPPASAWLMFIHS